MGLLESRSGRAARQGHQVTAFTNVEEDQAGATEWVKAARVHGGRVREARSGVFQKGDHETTHVRKAGNLITAQNPQSADARAAAVIAALA